MNCILCKSIEFVCLFIGVSFVLFLVLGFVKLVEFGLYWNSIWVVKYLLVVWFILLFGMVLFVWFIVKYIFYVLGSGIL